MFRLIQFVDQQGQRQVGSVDMNNGEAIERIVGVSSVYQLAQEAISAGVSLAAQVAGCQREPEVSSLTELLDQKRIRVPFDHPDPAHLFVTGTGLTHTGSADTRDKMHSSDAPESTLSDSMKMFRMGLEGGRPPAGVAGVQPEWFYKGDGSIVVEPGQPFPVPSFTLDASEEPEIAGCYLIGADGQPYRVGYALGNELSDHVTERQNYLFLAHSKLRVCSFGPELLVGELPADIQGISRIHRDGEVIWEKSFASGERNMSHSIANLEHHHFKYRLFRRPGDCHVHYFGTATLSFADMRTQVGDEFELSAPAFGKPLRNSWQVEPQAECVAVKVL